MRDDSVSPSKHSASTDLQAELTQGVLAVIANTYQLSIQWQLNCEMAMYSLLLLIILSYM